MVDYAKTVFWVETRKIRYIQSRGGMGEQF